MTVVDEVAEADFWFCKAGTLFSVSRAKLIQTPAADQHVDSHATMTFTNPSSKIRSEQPPLFVKTFIRKAQNSSYKISVPLSEAASQGT